MITTTNPIFDTRVDTKKMYVSINTHFVPRSKANKDGTSLLYLDVTGKGPRKRIPTDIYVPLEKWDRQSQLISSNENDHKDLNLCIAAIKSKITAIRITYRLTERSLDTEIFEEEYLRGIPRIDLIAFVKHTLLQERNQYSKGTFRKNQSFVKKLQKFSKQISFQSVDDKFIKRFRQWMYLQGNEKSTVEGYIAKLKKYIGLAERAGIPMPIKHKDIKVVKVPGNKVDLIKEEVMLLSEYYYSRFIKKNHSIVLGYFLFSCYNGNRISEIQSIERNQFNSEYIRYYERKNERWQRKKINNSTRKLVDHNSDLFVTKYADQYMNRILKDICVFVGIKKQISFHNGRHTFATNFLRLGGDVMALKNLLHHSSIDQTMDYVHIVEAETNDNVFVMDNLFD